MNILENFLNEVVFVGFFLLVISGLANLWYRSCRLLTNILDFIKFILMAFLLTCVSAIATYFIRLTYFSHIWEKKKDFALFVCFSFVCSVFFSVITNPKLSPEAYSFPLFVFCWVSFLILLLCSLWYHTILLATGWCNPFL